MSIEIGTVHAIGPKTKNNRHYRVTKVSRPEPFGIPANFMRTITLTHIATGTTWQVRVKPDAHRIPWNTRPMRVVTDADRTAALNMVREDVFNRVTDQLADVASETLHAPWREDITPARHTVAYHSGSYRFVVTVEGNATSLTWTHTTSNTKQRTIDIDILIRAFSAWCADRSA